MLDSEGWDVLGPCHVVGSRGRDVGESAGTINEKRNQPPHPLEAPFKERLPDVGYARDRAGNRDLHYDEFCLLLLLGLFNPVVDSLRGLQQASELESVQKLVKWRLHTHFEVDRFVDFGPQGPLELVVGFVGAGCPQSDRATDTLDLPGDDILTAAPDAGIGWTSREYLNARKSVPSHRTQVLCRPLWR